MAYKKLPSWKKSDLFGKIVIVLYGILGFMVIVCLMGMTVGKKK